MKKIILILFLLFPVSIFSALEENWDMENTRTGLHGYVLIPVPTTTGGGFSTTAPSPHSGSYRYNTILGGKWDRFPTELETALAGASAWTMDWWQWFQTKDAGTGGESHASVLSRGTNGSTGCLYIRILTNAWNPYGAGMDIILGGVGQPYIGSYSTTNYPDGQAGNRWARLSLIYTADGSYEFWIDGSRIWASATGKNNIFDSTTENGTFYTSSQFGNDYSSYWSEGIDDFKVALYDSHGDELTDATPTFTITPTTTETSTPTFTETFTPTFTPTFTVTPTVTPTCGLCVVYSDWQTLTTSAAWTARDKLSVITDLTGMYLIGGSTQDLTWYNDVYYSTDGIDWQTKTTNADFSKRGYHVSLYFDNKFWIISGKNIVKNPPYPDTTNFFNDVWSSDDGITWTLKVNPADFDVRYMAGGLVFNGEMWVIGGGISVGGSILEYADAWHSPDGVSWTAATTSAEFGTRKGMAVTVYAGKMWVIGGMSQSLGQYYNDVWSSTDGATWTQVTAAGPFVTSDSLSAFTLNGAMYVYAQTTGGMYRSFDGASWETMTIPGSVPGGGLREAGSLVYNLQFYLMGGYNGYDVQSVWTNPLWQYCLSATPTFTASPTFTKTPRLTSTPTASRTVTNTFTVTPSITVTKQVTPRVTRTPTSTHVHTLTPTRTVIVYALYSPTRTPTRCCTKTYIVLTPTPTRVSPWIQWGWPW